MKNLVPVLVVLGVLLLAVVAVVGLRMAFPVGGPVAPPAVVVPIDPPLPPHVRVEGDFVQFVSVRTKDEAKAALVTLKKYSDLFDADLLQVYEVEIGGKLWYRIVLKMKDRKSADRLCEIIKSRGGDCLAISFS